MARDPKNISARRSWFVPNGIVQTEQACGGDVVDTVIRDITLGRHGPESRDTAICRFLSDTEPHGPHSAKVGGGCDD